MHGLGPIYFGMVVMPVYIIYIPNTSGLDVFCNLGLMYDIIGIGQGIIRALYVLQ